MIKDYLELQAEGLENNVFLGIMPFWDPKKNGIAIL